MKILSFVIENLLSARISWWLIRIGKNRWLWISLLCNWNYMPVNHVNDEIQSAFLNKYRLASDQKERYFSPHKSFIFDNSVLVVVLIVGCSGCTRTLPWFCFLQILTHKQTKAQIKAKPTIPPTTLPAIAPGEDEPYINNIKQMVKQSMIHK